jgi:hypothetical protein
MFSFDGFRFEYLIGSASADGTTKLSKPEVNLLTPRNAVESFRALTGRSFCYANRNDRKMSV